MHGLGPLFELEPRVAVVGGLEFREVLSVTRLEAGIADNVIPGEATATVNLRYPPDRTPAEAETFLATLVPDGATLEVVSNAAPGRVVADSPAVRALQAAGALAIRAEAGMDERRRLHAAESRRSQLRPGSHGARASPRRARLDRVARHGLRGAHSVRHEPDRRRCRLMELAQRIDELWASGELEPEPIEEAIALLDAGEVRVAERPTTAGWSTSG